MKKRVSSSIFSKTFSFFIPLFGKQFLEITVFIADDG